MNKLLGKREVGIILSIIIMTIIFSFLNPAFLRLENIQTILRASAFTGVMAIGVTWLLISGSIDLSIGAVAGMASVITATLIVKLGFPILFSFVLGLSSGVIIGTINYMLAFQIKIPAFLATIGTMYVGRGLALFISNGYEIYPLPDVIKTFGTGTPLGISWHFIIFIVLAIISEIVLFHTVYGLEVRATGSDREIARMTEVNVDKVNISTFIIVGILSALSGILLMSRLVTGRAAIGTGWELNAITACAIGGVSLFGHDGSFLGAVLGIIAIQIITSGLVLVGLSAYLNTIVVGTILIITAGFDWQRRTKLNL